jgi:hypothetical protein
MLAVVTAVIHFFVAISNFQNSISYARQLLFFSERYIYVQVSGSLFKITFQYMLCKCQNLFSINSTMKLQTFIKILFHYLTIACATLRLCIKILAIILRFYTIRTGYQRDKFYKN